MKAVFAVVIVAFLALAATMARAEGPDDEIHPDFQLDSTG